MYLGHVQSSARRLIAVKNFFYSARLLNWGRMCAVWFLADLGATAFATGELHMRTKGDAPLIPHRLGLGHKVKSALRGDD